MRHDGRQANQLRELKIVRQFTRTAPGSVLFQAGGTTVLCTASLVEGVPEWMAGKGRGWLTAEYNMLPGSTRPRKRRERDGKLDGRTSEIQRLIGRSLRAVVNLAAWGERTLSIDCDVLEADGGTRTASITGALIAVVDALTAVPEAFSSGASPLRDTVAAISVGIVQGEAVLDLDYREDMSAEVDMNVVMTGAGQFVEVQGTGEGGTFSHEQLGALLGLATAGIEQLATMQRDILREHLPGLLPSG